MSELVPSNPQQQAMVPAPFGRNTGVALAAANAGSVSIEQERAIAEAQGQLTLAKRFPRDLTTAHAELMTACKSPAFAAVAFYNKPQGGGTVSGPSIRMAEEIARVVGNFQYGHRELSRDDKKSEVEVFALDMEKNNRSIRQITVMHVRDTRDGPKKLRDQSDVDQKIANIASKAVRGLILAQMPKWLVEDAIQECKKTLTGSNTEPLEVRIRRMTQAFANYGVKPEHIEKRLGKKLDAMLLDELVEYQGIYNALRDGAPASEYFGEQAEEVSSSHADSVKQTINAAKAATSAGGDAKPQVQAQAEPQAQAPAPAPAPASTRRTASTSADSKNAAAPAATKPAEAPAPAAAPAQAPAPAATEPAPEAQGDTSDSEERDIF